MAGHTQTGNNDILSVLEEDFKEPLRYIERVKQEILELVQKPDVRVVSVVWENRFENSKMAKHLAKGAMESGKYDVVTWIDPIRDFGPRKMQMRLAEKLGVQLSRVKAREVATATTEEEEEEEEKEDENEVQKEGAVKIFYELFNRRLKLLLVLDCVRKSSINLTELGLIYPELLKGAKFVFMTDFQLESYSFNNLTVDRVYNINDQMGSIGSRERKYFVSEMLVTGARDVANSLRMNHRITLEPQTTLYCIAYLLLMPTPQGRVSEEELSRYYMGEGLIPLTVDGKEDMNIDRASAVTKAVLKEIVNHAIFNFQSDTETETNGIVVQMDPCLWEALMAEKYRYQQQLRIATEGQQIRESNCKWISQAMQNIRTLPPSPNWSIATTLLLYGNLELKSIPDDFFEHMTSLRMLDLSRTALSSLPKSICCLRNCLRFIKLQNCPSLETLLPSFKHLESLQLLDLYNTPLSTMPNDSFEHMSSLLLIDLSHTKIRSLSSSISNCCKLEQLFLRGCQSLETLPPGVFRLEKLQVLDISYASQLKSLPLPPSSHLPISSTSLKKLLLAHCKALVFFFMPHLQQLPALEELDISGCTVLGLEDIPFNGYIPNLRVLDMSDSLIKLASLSLKGFQSLEMIQLRHLTNLEILDLSGTKIKEFPYEICELTTLKRLDLVNTRQLNRVQWEKIDWLPQVLYWDQCGCGKGRGWLSREMQLTSTNEGNAFALISVSNPNIFKNLNDSSPLWKNCFTQFHIHVSPCARQQQLLMKVVAPDFASKKLLPYRRVYERMQENHPAVPAHFCRYLEMDGVKSLNRVGLGGIKAIARQTESLWLHDNDFLTSLTGLDLEDSRTLMECRIERCHNMQNIFDKSASKTIHGPSRLWVSELLKLKTVYEGMDIFQSLQHLYLWWCPNLTSLFDWPDLPRLETLEISFCPNLKCIFQSKEAMGQYGLPQLHTLCLWDLRKLEFVCGGHLPALKKLKVGRCLKLQKLPIPPPISNRPDSYGYPNDPEPIEIQGESAWCDNLEWAQEEEESTRRPINFKRILSPLWCYNRHLN